MLKLEKSDAMCIVFYKVPSFHAEAKKNSGLSLYLIIPHFVLVFLSHLKIAEMCWGLQLDETNDRLSRSLQSVRKTNRVHN